MCAFFFLLIINLGLMILETDLSTLHARRPIILYSFTFGQSYSFYLWLICLLRVLFIYYYYFFSMIYYIVSCYHFQMLDRRFMYHVCVFVCGEFLYRYISVCTFSFFLLVYNFRSVILFGFFFPFPPPSLIFQSFFITLLIPLNETDMKSFFPSSLFLFFFITATWMFISKFRNSW